MKFLFMLVIAIACSTGDPQPAQPDEASTCAHCMMRVSDLRFAAQLVAKGEEPRFFDDIGCMRRHLAAYKTEAHWHGFVSDYDTKKWIPANDANYWKCESIETPMGSHIVATVSRQKPVADCTAMTIADLFGSGGAPGAAK